MDGEQTRASREEQERFCFLRAVSPDSTTMTSSFPLIYFSDKYI